MPIICERGSSMKFNRTVIALLIAILILQFMSVQELKYQIYSLQRSVGDLSEYYMLTNDVMVGRVCRLLEHFDLPTAIMKDNPDSTTSPVD